MRFLTSLIIVLTLLAPILADAYEVLVVVSSKHPVYEEALSGFREVRNFSKRVIYLSDYSNPDIQRVIREDQPFFILAVGDRALEFTRRIKRIPIISLMAFRFHKTPGTAPNITGVEFFVKPEPHLHLLSELRSRQVGILLNQGRNGDYLYKARQAADRYGMELRVLSVDTPKGVVGQLDHFKNSVDGLWMIPDIQAVNQYSAESIFLFSLKQHVPVISFDRHYLDLGATAIVEADRQDMGRLAGEMAAALLSGTPVSELPSVPPRKIIIQKNTHVMKRLGIPDDHNQK